MAVKFPAHIIGFPRLGAKRDLKWALEKYWRRDIDREELAARLASLRRRHWQLQQQAGLDLLTAGDFAFYDHVLELSDLLGVVPARHAGAGDRLARCFAMARGSADAPACEMKKWFNTNYHYLVPEFEAGMDFGAAVEGTSPPDVAFQVAEAATLDLPAKAVLTGPLTYLFLGRLIGAGGFAESKLPLADALAEAYVTLAVRIRQAGASWLQLDEPVLSLDVPESWLAVMARIYHRLAQADGPSIMLANYFGRAGARLEAVADLPIAGIHVDGVYGGDDLVHASTLFTGRVLSAGVVDGRNVWRANLPAVHERLAVLTDRVGELWVGSSCSLLHVPFSAEAEVDLRASIPVAFACEKMVEIGSLARTLEGTSTAADQQLFASASRAWPSRDLGWIDANEETAELKLSTRKIKPGWDDLLFPTTTIGSLPQTKRIRAERAKWRKGELSDEIYDQRMRAEIKTCVRKQEELGLDLLVHGECERNDMVEYFAHHLEGISVSKNGWVQSYGSRATRPPLIHGDIARAGPMTVAWSKYAASLSDRPMKGMLTGPITIICWSYPRADVPRMKTAFQLAEVLHQEVLDLQEAGLPAIQIDEPALREGLPLAADEWPAYLAQAVAAFNRITAGITAQVHTHMCYAEFTDIAAAIAALDVDVISLETSRTDMAVLAILRTAGHAAGIGPGVYDVHSPAVPEVDHMVALLGKALRHVPSDRLWVNPDCGLKTRGWKETEAALGNLVAAARKLRAAQP